MADKVIQIKDADDNNLFPITNYNNNVNIPSINGVPLIGNKTMEEILGCINGIKLLWENSSPTTEFAAQTIPLSENVSDYNCFLVSYGADAGNYYLQTAMVWLEKQSQLYYMTWGGARYQRAVTINANSIVFSNSSSNNSTSNGTNIPYRVYAISFKATTQEGGQGSGLVTLWTNPSTAGISTATYTLSDTADFYIIKSVYRSTTYTDTSGAHALTVAFDGIRTSAVMIGTDGRFIETRNYLIQNDQFTVYQGYEHDSDGAATALNDYCYPQVVYGVYLRPTTINQYNYSLPSVNNSNLVDLIYPIGSIYASTSSANPGTIVGGTWTQLTQNNYATKQWPTSPTTVASGGNISTTLSITTNGSPVFLSFDGDINPSGSGCWARAAIYRGTSVASGTLLARHTFQCVSSASYNQTFGVTAIDNVPAGTYTYLFYLVSGTGAFVLDEESAGPCSCNAFELGADPSLYKWRRTA